MKTAISASTIIALLSLGIQSVTADCYGSGDTFPDKGAARYHAERACRGWDGNAGAFQYWFGAGEAKNVCVQLSSTIKMEMTVQNLNNGQGFDLDDNDCVLRLHNEINGCDRGGASSIGGWYFRVDPNNGNC